MSPRARHLLLAWAPPAAWCALLFAASSLPLRTEEERFHGADKVVHILEYAVLGALAARALLLGRPAGTARGAVLLAAALAAAYGFTDEAHQLLVPERAFEWEDLGADAAGGLFGAAGYGLLARRRATVRRTSGSPDPRPSGPSGP